MRPIIQCVSNVFVKAMIFDKAGDAEPGHSHAFDHTTYVAAGRIALTFDEGMQAEYGAHEMIFVKKNRVHRIEALEDGTTVLCIHGLRDKDRGDDIIAPDAHPDERIRVWPTV